MNGVPDVRACRGSSTDQDDGQVRLLDLLIDELLELDTGRWVGRGEATIPESAGALRRIGDPAVADDTRAPEIFGEIEAEENPSRHHPLPFEEPANSPRV